MIVGLSLVGASDQCPDTVQVIATVTTVRVNLTKLTEHDGITESHLVMTPSEAEQIGQGLIDAARKARGA